MDPNYVNSLHALLQQATSPDSVALKAATASLQDYYRTPQCVPALFQILVSSQDAGIRQFAGVELRKRLIQHSGRYWLETPLEMRTAMKKQILEYILSEPIDLVRHTIARVIAPMANLELNGNTWPDLLPWLYQCATAPNPTTREIGVFIMYSLADNSVDAFAAHQADVYKLFRQTLQDPESMTVRVSTVRALGTMAQFIDIDEKQSLRDFQAIFPLMVAVVRDCVQTNNEDGARHVFDVVETLLVLDAPLISKQLPQLVDIMLEAASNKEVEEEIRVLAFNALIWTIKYRKTKLQQLQLAKPILERVMPVGCEEDPADEDEDNPTRLCYRTVDALATTLPPTHVFPALHALVQQYLSSADPSHRKCAMVCFGVAIEGCSEYIRPHLGVLWPFFDAGFNDPDWRVRKASCTALGCVCEYLGDEAAERHAVFLPAILRLLDDDNTRTQAVVALDNYLEVLGEAILPYLEPLMTQMLSLLESGDKVIKGTVVGAIGSAAHAAKSKFLPYFQVVMQRLEPLFFLKDEEDLELRSGAVDTAGTIAEAVGKEAFSPFFGPMMLQAVDGLQLDSARLKECGYLLFIVLARVFPEEFSPYLPTIVPALIESCKETEYGVQPNGATEITAGNGTAEAPLVLKADEDVEIDLDAVDAEEMLNVSSAQAVEKEIACDAMGQLFGSTKAAFLPYVEPCMEQLVELSQHFYEGIRRAAVQALCEYVRVFYELSGYQWIPGAVSQPPLHGNVVNVINVVIPAIIAEVDVDDDKNTVGHVCSQLADLITSCGPGVIGEHYEAMVTLCIQVLEGTHLSQQETEEDDAEDNVIEEQAEYDSVLTNSAMDLVAALAHVAAGNFAPAFGRLLPLIAQYAVKVRLTTDRSSAVGTMGECITSMKSGITPFTEPLYTIIFEALSDVDGEVRSNAAYALGRLVEFSTVDMSAQNMVMLSALRPFFDVTADPLPATINARDNASGAVSRMIIRNSSAMPLQQVLPTLFSALPLQKDFQENGPVFGCICYLYETSPEQLEPHWDGLTRLFRHVLSSSAEEIEDDTRQSLLNLIRHMNTVRPDRVASSGLSVYLA